MPIVAVGVLIETARSSLRAIRPDTIRIASRLMSAISEPRRVVVSNWNVCTVTVEFGPPASKVPSIKAIDGYRSRLASGRPWCR